MHALRIGEAIDAHHRGATLDEICARGGWDTKAVARRYALIASALNIQDKIQSTRLTVSEERARASSMICRLHDLPVSDPIS